jgi:hypothetical protein
MNAYVLEATVLLEQLPTVVLICPQTTVCVQIDNSAMIDQHIRAVRKLRALATRMLNRSSRLVYPDPKTAQAKTKAFGKRLKAIGKQVEDNANRLPRSRSQCTG